ncbi:MAG: hypothetical protein QXT53_05570 [Ignisphaera sp.]
MSYTVASIINRIVDALKHRVVRLKQRNRHILSYVINFALKLHDILSKEDNIINFMKAVMKTITINMQREDNIINFMKNTTISMQRLQCSLEDSLSVQSLLLQILSVISIVVVVMVAWLMH